MSMKQTGLFTSLLLVSFIFIFSNGDNKAGGFLPNFSFCRSLLYFYLGGGGGLYLPWCACGVQKTVYASRFSRSTTWAQMSELRSSSLVAVSLSTEPSHLYVSNSPPPPFVVTETGLPCVTQVSLRQSMYIQAVLTFLISLASAL